MDAFHLGGIVETVHHVDPTCSDRRPAVTTPDGDPPLRLERIRQFVEKTILAPDTVAGRTTPLRPLPPGALNYTGTLTCTGALTYIGTLNCTGALRGKTGEKPKEKHRGLDKDHRQPR